MTNLRILFLLVLVATFAGGIRGDSEQDGKYSYWIFSSQPHLHFVSATLVISSPGGAAIFRGEVLGQYEYDEDNGCYVQKSTEQSNGLYIKRYLCSKYFKNIKWWFISPEVIESEASLVWMRSKKLRTGWEYYDGDTLQPDPSMTVIPGSLPPLPSQFTVKASGDLGEEFESSEFQYLSVFNKTERWWSGRPIYVNDQGDFLYHESRWTIGTELGYYSLQGTKSYQSPVCEKSWSFLPSNGSDDKPASVKIVPGDGELKF